MGLCLACRKGQVVTLPVSLSARPLEYAGLWLRNALLMLLTLGLYAPWAQVRARRYFCGAPGGGRGAG